MAARGEIVDAVRRDRRGGAQRASSIRRPSTKQTIAAHLYTAGMPDPDLLIRTAGEMRISNFLLWQISYAELWVTEKCWPEFETPTCTRRFATLPPATGGLVESSSSRVQGSGFSYDVATVSHVS